MKSILWIAATLLVFAASAQAGDCQKTASVCVEGPETRNISGLVVTRDCWRYRDTYTCLDQSLTDDCQALRDQGCSQTGSACVDTSDLDGTCTLFEQTYRCQTSPGATSTITDCGSQSFCLDGNCADTSSPPDTDFARAAAMMEAQREAGVYLDPDTMTIFNGVANTCSKKLGGLSNCCKKNARGGDSNNVLAQAMVLNAVKNAGGYLLNKTSNLVGSTYAFDSLFQSEAPDFMVNGMSSMFGEGGGFAGGFAPSLNFMGLGVTFGGAAPVGSTVFTGVSSQSMTVYFNPTTFYWSIALMVIQEIMSCEQEEQVLAMKRGSNLCVPVGSYCSSKFLGSCVVKKESFCCFNSRLARIINEQGRAQIGRGWGSPQSPACTGFTMAEMELLDFGAMDLAEFYAEIAPDLPQAGGVSGRAASYDITPLKSKVPVTVQP